MPAHRLVASPVRATSYIKSERFSCVHLTFATMLTSNHRPAEAPRAHDYQPFLVPLPVSQDTGPYLAQPHYPVAEFPSQQHSSSEVKPARMRNTSGSKFSLGNLTKRDRAVSDNASHHHTGVGGGGGPTSPGVGMNNGSMYGDGTSGSPGREDGSLGKKLGKAIAHQSYFSGLANKDVRALQE